MVDVKIVVVSVVAMSFVFLQPGITAHPTNSSTTEDDYCSLLEVELEFQRVQNMRMRNLLKTKEQKINTLENERRQVTTVRALGKERRRLTTIKTPQSERRTLGPRKSQPVTPTFIDSFDNLHSSWTYRQGITQVEDKIYVLHEDPNRIKVYDDLVGFRFLKDIELSGTNSPYDIVYSNESKCVYISDFGDRSIWVMTTTGAHRLTKWLTNVTKMNGPNTLSLSNEGHLLVQSFNQDSLEIYSLNATLIRRLNFPQDVEDPRHVIQTSTGNFIMSHRLNNPASANAHAISQLANDGQLINRFIPRNQSERLENPQHLSLDSDNNRLFVADYFNNRVILFDARDLTWSQVLLSKEANGIRYPFRLFYDASKKQLFVAQLYANVTVYEIP